MAPLQPGLTVLVVTYGARWHLLSRVLSAVDDAAVAAGMVVVDNGSTANIQVLVDRSGWATPVDVIGDGTNRGSAGGFARGLDYVAQQASGATHVLMLDDDNIPAPGSLRRLWASLVAAEDRHTAFMMERTSRAEIQKLLRTGRPVRHAENSFCGVSLRHGFRDWRDRLRGPPGVYDSSLEFAPYGGLVLPIDVVRSVGLPRAEYVLYADDHEFTTRLCRSGFGIEMVRGAVLEDAEPSWHGTSTTLIASADPRQPALCTYYAVRNRRHLEVTLLTHSRIEQGINAVAFLGALTVDVLTLLIRREAVGEIIGRLRLLRRAISDGAHGRLGVAAAEYGSEL